MPRPLSPTSRKVLRQMGKAIGASLDELAARTGIRKDKLAKLLWHLQRGGWIAPVEETRLLTVYRRLKDLPAAQAATRPAPRPASHIEALEAVFGIRRPVGRVRGRTIRRGE